MSVHPGTSRTGDRVDYCASPPVSSGAGEVRFTLLGQLEVLKDGVDHAPSAPKVLQLLALLLSRPGRVVHVDTIVEELWADRPPRSVRSTLQTYVYHLRRCIEQHGLAPEPETMLATRLPGYVLRVAPAQVDVWDFRARCATGRDELAAGRGEQAAGTLRSALALWSGDPLANVERGPVLAPYCLDLTEQHRAAQHLRIEAEMSCGAHRELVGELRALTTADALDEGLHAQLMQVLARSGRRSEALATYRDLRTRLARELGVEPGRDLQSLHLELLVDDGARLLAG